jgi:hypothetical protein
MGKRLTPNLSEPEQAQAAALNQWFAQQREERAWPAHEPLHRSPSKRVGRPRGSYGEITVALVEAARQAPGTVRELAQRAQVGFACAERKASCLVKRGDLVVVQPNKPMVLAVPTAATVLDNGSALQAVWRGAAVAGITTHTDHSAGSPSARPV